MESTLTLNIYNKNKQLIDLKETDPLIVETLFNTTTRINDMCVDSFSFSKVVDNIVIKSKNKDFYLDFSSLVIKEDEKGNEYLNATYIIESILIK